MDVYFPGELLLDLHESTSLLGVGVDLLVLDHEPTHAVEVTVPPLIFQELVLRFDEGFVEALHFGLHLQEGALLVFLRRLGDLLEQEDLT